MKRNLEIKQNLSDVNQLQYPDFTWIWLIQLLKIIYRTIRKM